MDTEKRNSFGLFDAARRSPEKERVTFTQTDIERQLDAGAFLMSREEAVTAGFINPQDEQDTVIVDIREERKRARRHRMKRRAVFSSAGKFRRNLSTALPRPCWRWPKTLNKVSRLWLKRPFAP